MDASAGSAGAVAETVVHVLGWLSGVYRSYVLIVSVCGSLRPRVSLPKSCARDERVSLVASRFSQ